MKIVSLDRYSFMFVQDDVTEEQVKEYYRLIYGHMIEHFFEKADRVGMLPTMDNEEKQD